jgi:hypothetical protein
MVVSGWYRLRKQDGKEFLAASVQDRTPAPSEGGLSGIPERPRELWVFEASGEARKYATLAEFGAAEYSDIPVGPHPVRWKEPWADKDRPAVEMEIIGDFPNKAAIPMQAGPVRLPDGTQETPRLGFSMWVNAGRPKTPSMEHYKGNGIRISRAGTKLAFDRKTGLPSDRASCAYLAGPDLAYVGFYDSSVARIELAQRRVNRLTFAPREPRGVSLIQEASKRIFIGTFSEGLYVTDAEGRRASRVAGIPDCRVNDLVVEPDAVWTATSRGLFRVALPSN